MTTHTPYLPLRYCLCAALVVLALGTPTSALAKRALPGEQCRIGPVETWTEPEEWVWEQVCVGAVADFNARDREQNPGLPSDWRLDPTKPEGWTVGRTLSSGFLETILLHEPYRGSLKRQGVRITGAYFTVPVDLTGAQVSHDLTLAFSRFEQPVDLSEAETSERVIFDGSLFAQSVDLRRARVGGLLAMIGSTFNGPLHMNDLDVALSIFMRGGAQFKDVDLGGARVGTQLSMTGSIFMDRLDMHSLWVKASLYMNSAQFNEVNLENARVDGPMEMFHSTFARPLIMNNLQVKANLYMDGAQFNEVALRGARVGGLLNMAGSTFTGPLNLGSLQVASSLSVADAKLEGYLYLVSAKIGEDLDLTGSELGSLDLTGTRIEGELRLASARPELPRWREGGRLVLRNATVWAFQDWADGEGDAWPPELQLDGFTYERLGGLAGDDRGSDLSRRPVDWFVGWLVRDRSYAPQPYHELAKLLRETGQTEKADEILYAGRERERRAAWGLERLGLDILNMTIGYGFGYRYFYALFWVAALVGLGVLMLWAGGERKRHGMTLGIAYSLDMLLPIIRLRDAHYDIDLVSTARYYFYVHKVMGYVLASFLVAGLAGLTK